MKHAKKLEERRTKALTGAPRDKMLKRPNRDTQQKPACTKGHEGQCVAADPERSGDCECRCLGANHGKDRK